MLVLSVYHLVKYRCHLIEYLQYCVLKLFKTPTVHQLLCCSTSNFCHKKILCIFLPFFIVTHWLLREASFFSRDVHFAEISNKVQKLELIYDSYQSCRSATLVFENTTKISTTMIIPKGLYNTFFSTFGFNILKMAFPGCIFIW